MKLTGSTLKQLLGAALLVIATILGTLLFTTSVDSGHLADGIMGLFGCLIAAAIFVSVFRLSPGQYWGAGYEILLQISIVVITATASYGTYLLIF